MGKSYAKMDEKLILFIALYFVAAEGQTFHFGQCPTPPVQADFKLEKYLGKWYEIEKLPAHFEKGVCIQAEYSLGGNGTIKVLNQELLPDGKWSKIEGEAIQFDLQVPAKLGVSFNSFMPYAPYWVLSTDYNDYSLVYSCTNVLWVFYFDFAWILSRDRQLPQKTIDQLKTHLTTYNIKIDYMKSTIQSGCPDNA
ncbi:apolipoprotein D [Protopterus annectens]|uniref:apolipoprotein D n=1 Tax=Protopterus annectens TaxID=7888 RepID=UPI001CFA38E7|nr:apolipoprotein D [Protopterus annectens]